MKSIICIFIVLYSSKAIAQNIQPANLSHKDSLSLHRHGNLFLTAGAEFMWQSYKDIVTSPLAYKSTSPIPALNLGFYNKRPNQYSSVVLQLGTQFANSSAGTYYGFVSSILSYLNLNFGRCFTIDSIVHKRVVWQLGYRAEVQYFQFVNTKFENSAYSYAIWANAGLSNRFIFPFVLNTPDKVWIFRFHQPKQYGAISWQVDIPVAEVITRPNYAGIEHFANGEVVKDALNEISQNIRFASFQNFIEVKSKIELSLPLGNHNLFNIGYNWMGYNYSYDRRSVQGNQNSLYIGLQFKLDGRTMIH